MITTHLETPRRALSGRYTTLGMAPLHRYPRTLAEAVEMAVHEVDASCLQSATDLEAGLTLQASTLLGLLAYFYARQVYSSNEIAAQLTRERKPFRGNEINLPDAGMLQTFRADNHEPLAFCLREALWFLAEEKIRQGVVTHVKRVHIHREANRRIIMAMFTDSLEEPRPQAPSSFS